MTREEAKEKLKTVLKGRKDKRGKTETDEALEMAIKALEQEPCEDAISREEIKNMIKTKFPMCMGLIREIDSLPSVEPASSHFDCEDCMFYPSDDD